jgi:hypothetical protein
LIAEAFMRHVFLSILLFAVSVPAFATVDSGLLALVPSGAKVISGVDANRAKSSRFGQYILSKINADNPDFQQLTQETGFDPRRDVQDVLFVGTGPAADGSDLRFGILVRGNFDQERVKKTLIAKGATVQSYQGVEVLLDSSSHPGNAFAFPDVDIAVLGDLATVQQMIANRANPTALDPALQQLVSAAGANHDAWFASSGPGSFLANHVRQEAGQQMGPQALQSILQSSGGISFGDVVQLSLDAVTRSPKDASSLADVVRFGASMAELQHQNKPGAAIVASSLDKMALTTDGSNVHVSLSIPENGLEQLAEINGLQHRHGGSARPTTPSVR